MTAKVMNAVLQEAISAHSRYGQFSSSHEALGVLTEEYYELLDAIRANDLSAIYREAIQVSSVALRIAQATDNDLFARRSAP